MPNRTDKVKHNSVDIAHPTGNEFINVSEQLLNEFSMLKDVQDVSGNAKFTVKSVDKLATHLVCRHYGNLCYELAHLHWAILHSQGTKRAHSQRLLDFFWVCGGHTSGGATQFFAQDMSLSNDPELPFLEVSEHASLRLMDRSVEIRIFQHSFSVNSSRFNLLACFMEWLVCIVPNVLDHISSILAGQGLNAIKDLSSELQKYVYHYVNEHLPPAKLQARYHKLNKWYQLNELNDKSIINFWTSHNTIDGFGKFTGCVYDTFSYIEAGELTSTQKSIRFSDEFDEQYQASANAKSLEYGIDNEDSSSLFSLFSDHQQHLHIDLALAQEPVKAMNQQQVENLSLVASFPLISSSYCQTVLRANVFGKYQHQLIQANRRQIAHSQWPELDTDYQYFKRQCIETMAANQQCLLACVDILLNIAPQSAVGLIKALCLHMPKFANLPIQLGALVETSNSQAGLGDHDIMQIIEKRFDCPLLQDFLDASKQAFKQINRKGFTKQTLAQEHDYVSLAETLLDINRVMKDVLNTISAKNLSADINFEADRFMFKHEFSKLYV